MDIKTEVTSATEDLEDQGNKGHWVKPSPEVDDVTMKIRERQVLENMLLMQNIPYRKNLDLSVDIFMEGLILEDVKISHFTFDRSTVLVHDNTFNITTGILFAKVKDPRMDNFSRDLLPVDTDQEEYVPNLEIKEGEKVFSFDREEYSKILELLKGVGVEAGIGYAHTMVAARSWLDVTRGDRISVPESLTTKLIQYSLYLDLSTIQDKEIGMLLGDLQDRLF